MQALWTDQRTMNEPRFLLECKLFTVTGEREVLKGLKKAAAPYDVRSGVIDDGSCPWPRFSVCDVPTDEKKLQKLFKKVTRVARKQLCLSRLHFARITAEQPLSDQHAAAIEPSIARPIAMQAPWVELESPVLRFLCKTPLDDQGSELVTSFVLAPRPVQQGQYETGILNLSSTIIQRGRSVLSIKQTTIAALAYIRAFTYQPFYGRFVTSTYRSPSEVPTSSVALDTCYAQTGQFSIDAIVQSDQFVTLGDADENRYQAILSPKQSTSTALFPPFYFRMDCQKASETYCDSLCYAITTVVKLEDEDVMHRIDLRDFTASRPEVANSNVKVSTSSKVLSDGTIEVKGELHPFHWTESGFTPVKSPVERDRKAAPAA